VERTSSEGSRRLIRAAAAAGGQALADRKLTAEQIERRRRTALELNLARHLRPGYHGPWWTPEQLALLGTLPDTEVAARIGRTPGAVRSQRTLRGIPNALDRRRREVREASARTGK
jgi:hypothetical protein